MEAAGVRLCEILTACAGAPAGCPPNKATAGVSPGGPFHLRCCERSSPNSVDRFRKAAFYQLQCRAP